MAILGLALLCIGILSFKKNKGIDFLALFCLIWTVVFLGASLKLYGMREYSLETISIFCFGTVSFVVFFVIAKYGRMRHITIKDNMITIPFRKDVAINKKIVWSFFIITTFFVIYSLFRMLGLMIMGIPMGTIHAMYLNRGGEPFYSVSVINQLNSKVMMPCIYTMAPIISYFLLFDFKKNRVITLLGIVDLVIYTVATGSRLILIFLAVDIFLTIPLAKIKIPKRVFKKVKKIGFVLGLLVGVMLVYYTISRKGFTSSSEESVISQVFGEIYKYLTLCIPLSDFWFGEIDQMGTWTYGKMFFFSILSIIEWFFAQFFRTETFAWLNICRELASSIEIMQPIFLDAKCNAFVTYLFYFYVDFRMIGVIVGSSLFGYISGKIDRNTRRTKNQSSIMFYLLFAQTISMSFIRWSFYDVPYLIGFILLRIYFVRGKSKHENIYNNA